MNFKNSIESLSWIFESAELFNNFPDIILYINGDGIVLKSNQKAKDCFNLLSNITINEIIKDGMKQIRQSIKLKKSILVTARGKDGEFYAELTATRFGKNFCISLRNKTQLIDEITSKNNTEKFNNEKNAMIYKIGDELKSPANSIIGFSQGLADGIAGELSEKQAKYLKIINTNALDLQEFTEKFIEFSYCESSLYEPSIKKFDVVSDFKEIIKDFSQKLDSQKVNIYFEYDNIESRNIYFDQNAFKRAFTNIIEACLSMTESGIITIHLAVPDEETAISFGLNEEKQYLQVIIKDTGVGISKEEMKHMCNPYAQIDKGRKNFLRSLRFGIASILIKRSEGFISINSDVSQGTFYNVIIPVEKVQDE